MLKQALKTINTEFIQTCALSQLSFVYFRPYATSFPGLLLSLMVMSKRKKDPGDKSGPYVFIQDLLLNVCCVLFIGATILFKRNMTEKDVCHTHAFLLLDYNFSFCTEF